MKSNYKKILGALAIILSSLFGYDQYDAMTNEPEGMPSTTEVRSLVGNKVATAEKVKVCYYDIQAVEQMKYVNIVKIANFKADTSVTYDIYHQTKKYRALLPGNNPERSIDLVKIVPLQNHQAEIIGIASVEQVGDKCKIYDFSSPSN